MPSFTLGKFLKFWKVTKSYRDEEQISFTATGGGYNTGNMVDYNTGIYYNTNHSLKFCAGKNEARRTAITPITTGFHEITPLTP